MQELTRKIKKVEPILRLKQRKLEDEAQALAAIRQEKVRIVASMKDSQKRYLEGYESLNTVRRSDDRKNLQTLEEALDSVKDQWHRLMVQVQEVERREQAQITHFLTAERDLRSIEKLKEKYQTEINRSMQRHEQKLLDEHALRKFTNGD